MHAWRKGACLIIHGRCFCWWQRTWKKQEHAMTKETCKKTTIFWVEFWAIRVEFLTMELRRSLLEGTCFVLLTGFQMDAIINFIVTIFFERLKKKSLIDVISQHVVYTAWRSYMGSVFFSSGGPTIFPKKSLGHTETGSPDFLHRGDCHGPSPVRPAVSKPWVVAPCCCQKRSRRCPRSTSVGTARGDFGDTTEF